MTPGGPPQPAPGAPRPAAGEPQPRPPAGTTLTAAVLALGMGVLALAVAGLEIRRALGDAELERQQGAAILGQSAGDSALGILAWLTAGLALVVGLLALTIGLGMLLRRPWAREGGLAVFGLVAVVTVAVSVNGLTAQPPARNAGWGLAFGGVSAAIVALLVVPATRVDVNRADFFRQRRSFAAAEQRRRERQAARGGPA